MRTTEIIIPDWFKKHMKFKSKWINNGDNIYTLISFNATSNLAEVEIKFPSTEFIEDVWDLQSTIWAFEKGECTLIE